MNDSELIDTETIESLQSVLEDGIYELFNEFIKDSPENIERLANAIKDNDTQEISQAAHYLKGSGSNIGAIAFSNACMTLELQAKDNSLTEPEIQMGNVRQLFEETVHYMKKQMA